jgi:hypothetical protein
MQIHRCVSCEVRTPSTYKKVKLSLEQAAEAYRVVEMLRIPHCLDSRLTDDDEVSITHRPHFAPRKIPGTNFCSRSSWSQGQSEAGRIRSIEISNDLISNQTRDLSCEFQWGQPGLKTHTAWNCATNGDLKMTAFSSEAVSSAKGYRHFWGSSCLQI